MYKSAEKEFGFTDVAPDTGVPLNLFEEHTFPKYSTDETREQSLLELIPHLVNAVKSAVDDYGVLPQDAFDSIINEYELDQFPEVVHYFWRQLPKELQIDISY
jgi:hypothetical protein